MGTPPCCDKTGLKKGPWAQEEDLKLTQYIQIHGPGNWRSLPDNAGLQRCGKSCRLRWTNYLRPDIKRGRFSYEEEETIIQLHSLLGNKWSAIAARLPGRTDNEIKNYWNTHIRKKLLQNGIDPVTHAPRLDLSDLSTILINSAQINLSNLLNLQTLVHPHLLTLVTLLASSSSNQENQQLLLNNHINTMNQCHNQQTENYFNSMHLSQENVLPPFSIDNSVTLPYHSPQFTAQTSENLSFLPSNIENKILTNQNFDFDSILSIPMSSPAHVTSPSSFH